MNEFWAAIAGAIVGALASALATLLLQRQQFEKEKTELRESQMLSLFYKLRVVAKDLEDIAHVVDECGRKAMANGGMAQGWEWLTPQATYPTPVVITDAEKSCLLSLKKVELFNEVCDVENLHRVWLDTFRSYGEMRRALTNSLPAGVVDGVMHSDLNDLPSTQRLTLHVKIQEVNSLAAGLWDKSRGYAEIAEKALSMLNDALKPAIGYNFTLAKDDQGY